MGAKNVFYLLLCKLLHWTSELTVPSMMDSPQFVGVAVFEEMLKVSKQDAFVTKKSGTSFEPNKMSLDFDGSRKRK